MASFYRRDGCWRAQLCIKGFRESKSFATKGQAVAWAKVRSAALKADPILAAAKRTPAKPVLEFAKLSQLKSESEIVSAATAIDLHAGIYFLIRGEKIVYVGKSLNVHSRIAAHRPSKEFDKVHIITCRQESLGQLESMYIKSFNPELNVAGRSDRIPTPLVGDGE